MRVSVVSECVCVCVSVCVCCVMLCSVVLCSVVLCCVVLCVRVCVCVTAVYADSSHPSRPVRALHAKSIYGTCMSTGACMCMRIRKGVCMSGSRIHAFYSRTFFERCMHST